VTTGLCVPAVLVNVNSHDRKGIEQKPIPKKQTLDEERGINFSFAEWFAVPSDML
jgi:hypothetical protein